MAILKFAPHALILLLFSVGLNSCVKDVDLNQAKDISLKPKLQIDLLIFDVDEFDFVDTLTNQQKNHNPGYGQTGIFRRLLYSG